MMEEESSSNDFQKLWNLCLVSFLAYINSNSVLTFLHNLKKTQNITFLLIEQGTSLEAELLLFCDMNNIEDLMLATPRKRH